MKNNNKKESQKFEEAFDRLKEVIALIERPNNNLENLVDLVEEGMKLSKLCEQKLKAVQDKINVISDKYSKD